MVVGKDDVCCAICEMSHVTISCFRIIQVHPVVKLESVGAARLCFACLKKGHIARYCELSEKCGKDGCVHTHHVLLHEAWASTSNGKKEPPKVEVTWLHLASVCNLLKIV